VEPSVVRDGPAGRQRSQEGKSGQSRSQAFGLRVSPWTR
jgi:hypothetical protein